MLSPQKISSVTSVERASSVSILSPAVSVTASVEPTENEWPSVSVRVTVYPCESVTGAIITGISRASPVQSMGEGGVTVIVCADALTDPSSMPIEMSPAIVSPPLALTTALLSE